MVVPYCLNQLVLTIFTKEIRQTLVGLLFWWRNDCIRGSWLQEGCVVNKALV